MIKIIAIQKATVWPHNNGKVHAVLEGRHYSICDYLALAWGVRWWFPRSEKEITCLKCKSLLESWSKLDKKESDG